MEERHLQVLYSKGGLHISPMLIFYFETLPLSVNR
jgi:hypothetical protein